MFVYVSRMPSGGACHWDGEATEAMRKCVRSSLLLPQLETNNWTIRFYLYCVGIVSWRFTNKNNVASFSHGCQHRFSKWKKKVLKLKLLPLVLEKAWLSVCSSCFAWKLVHRYTTLSIIEIKNLRPSPAGSTAKTRFVGQRGTMMGRCSPETGVLPPRDRCPSFAMSSLSSTSFVPNGQLVMVPTWINKT